MKVKDLVYILRQYDSELPVCINDYIGFIEANEETIVVEKKPYVCFPFTDNDTFEYVNLRSNEYGS